MEYFYSELYNIYTFYGQILIYLIICVFFYMLIDVQELPADDLGNIETCQSLMDRV